MNDFDEWWATINQTIGEVAARAAWDHQQAEIERLKGYLEFLRIHCDSAYTYKNIEAGIKALDKEQGE